MSKVNSTTMHRIAEAFETSIQMGEQELTKEIRDRIMLERDKLTEAMMDVLGEEWVDSEEFDSMFERAHLLLERPKKNEIPPRKKRSKGTHKESERLHPWHNTNSFS